MTDLLREVYRTKIGQILLEALSPGAARYTDLARVLADSGRFAHPQTLSRTLGHLRRLGLVEKRHAGDRDEYLLTVRGRQVVRVLKTIQQADAELTDIDAASAAETPRAGAADLDGKARQPPASGIGQGS